MIGSHDVQHVRRSAFLANTIYETANEHLIMDAATDAQASVCFDDDATYITFRGSESRTDWWMNIMLRFRFADILPTDSYIRAHSGFVYQWQGVREEILKLLERHHDDKKPVVCCGHSLGGAVATIAALDLRMTMFLNTTLVSFGSPRALNWYAKEAFESVAIPAYRVTNGADVVSMVPIVCLHHVGVPTEVNAKPWWYLVSILDHSMAVYAAWGASL